MCIFCDEREIEDEIHFAVRCPRYQTYRDSFFTYICRNVSKKFMNNDAVDKFIFLMKLNGKHIRKFANYLVSIWEYRKSILYTNN